MLDFQIKISTLLWIIGVVGYCYGIYRFRDVGALAFVWPVVLLTLFFWRS